MVQNKAVKHNSELEKRVERQNQLLTGGKYKEMQLLKNAKQHVQQWIGLARQGGECLRVDGQGRDVWSGFRIMPKAW